MKNKEIIDTLDMIMNHIEKEIERLEKDKIYCSDTIKNIREIRQYTLKETKAYIDGVKDFYIGK